MGGRRANHHEERKQKRKARKMTPKEVIYCSYIGGLQHILPVNTPT